MRQGPVGVKTLLKSCLHNVGVVAVGFAIALVGRGLDAVVGLPAFGFAATVVAGTNNTAPSSASVSPIAPAMLIETAMLVEAVLPIETALLVKAALLIAGLLLLLAGFLLRVWATYHFYEHRMRVIRLTPQSTLLTTGPYRWTRNPLCSVSLIWGAGNVFIFWAPP